VECEGRARAVAQHALEPGPVVGGDAHGTVQAEAAGAAPREHVRCICLGEEAPTHVQAQDAALEDRRESPCALGVEVTRREESEWTLRSSAVSREEPVGDRQVEVRMGIEPGAEAVQEGDGSEPHVVREAAPGRGREFGSHRTEQDPEDGAAEGGIPGEMWA